MNATFTRRRLTAITLGTIALGPVTFAQSVPAARMLPAVPGDPPVSRAAPPGPAYDVPASVPAPTFGRQQRPTTSAVQPEKSRGVVSGTIDAVKGMFGGKSEPTAATGYADPAAGNPPVSRTPAVPYSPQPAPGVYAGPPAYRWYGYGSPTPGTNPYSPTGLYPKASANWYTMTGATPGAFPVPVTVGGRPNGFEPPSYASVLPADGYNLTGTRVPTADVTRPRSESVEPPRPVAVSEPQVPYGSGSVIATPPQASDLTQDLQWQPVTARGPQPIASSRPYTPPMPSPPPPPADPGWSPVSRPAPDDSNPAPSISMIRGQAPDDDRPDVSDLIRSTCFGRADEVTVTRLGSLKLHVRLKTPTEVDARDAAALVSRLPQLKPYTVTFEATVSR